MTLTHEEQATKAIARRSQEAGIGLHEVVTDAIRKAVEEANTLNVSNIIGAAKDKIEAVDKAKADARKKAFRECKPYIDHHWECATRDPKMAGMEPCTCGLDDLREEMEASDDRPD